ncbi:MAG: hypothetical protein Q4G69_03005 [Planctomycetia bacterium]|nr:hypothetical protein [Planctomycetia bacterium]
MQKYRRFFLLLFVSILSVSFFSSDLSYGAEDWERFLQELIQKGQYDTAIEYLKTTIKQSSCPDSLKEEYYYRLGSAQLEHIKDLSGEARIQELLSAKGSFQSFLKDHPNHAQALSANYDLARILLVEGKQKILEADQIAQSEEEKQLRMRDARDLLKNTEPCLNRVLELARTRISELKTKEKGKTSAEMEQLQSFYLGSRILLASLPSEIAETWKKGSEEEKQGLLESKGKLNEISTKYRQYTGSFSARYREALIAYKLGEKDLCRAITAELAALPMDPVFYQIKTDSLQLRFRLFMEDRGLKTPEEKNAEPKMDMSDQNYSDLLKLIRDFDDWKKAASLPKSYYTSSAGQAIHLDAARILIYLDKLRNNQRNEVNKAIRKFFDGQDTPLAKTIKAPTNALNYANQILEFVRKLGSPLSLEAEDLQKDPAFANIAAAKSDKQEGSLESLLPEARKSWLLYVRANQEYAQASDESAKAEAKKALDQAREEAEKTIRTCLDLVPQDTSSESINEIRLNLSILYFMNGKYEDSFEIANTLCMIPDFTKAPKAAETALYSLRRSYNQAKTEGKPAADLAKIDSRINELALHIDRRWGDGTEGNLLPIVLEAILVQIDASVAAGNVDYARQCLERIPAESPQRGTAELRFGQSLWAEYLRLIAEANDSDKKEQTSKETILEEARKSLENGLTRILSASQGKEEDYLTVYSALSLAQIFLLKGDTENANKWLTHPVIGPWHLASASSGKGDHLPAQFDESFRMGTLILMLRIQIKKGNFAEAEKTMEQIELLGKGDKKSGDRLTAIYVQLGKQLEDQLRQLSDAANAGDPQKQKELKEVSEGFERFLGRISERQDGNTWNSLRWIADTFMSLGRGIAGSLSSTPPEAVVYFTKAGRTWQTILKKIKEDPSWSSDPNADLLVILRLSECLRATGRYESAVRILLPMIQKHPNNLELQIEGARIYQDWGFKENDRYIRAILGGEPGKNAENQIWGWNRILSRLARSMEKDSRYQNYFYESYLNKFTCRYRYSRRLGDPAMMKKHAEDAERELLRLRQMHPDLGGPAFQKKFEDHQKRLKKQIEQTE